MLKGLDERTTSIYAPVQPQLNLVEDRLRELSQTDAPYLAPLLDYLLASGGKRIRPAITLLAADFYPHDQVHAVTMASAVELLHVATLIHDDTVDNSDLRRGKATVGNLWGQHVAVLFGDYVFATSATFVCEIGNVRVIRRFSETIMELASGEPHRSTLARLMVCRPVSSTMNAFIARPRHCFAPQLNQVPYSVKPLNPRYRP